MRIFLKLSWLLIGLALMLAGCAAFPIPQGAPATPAATSGPKGLETRPEALDAVQSRLAGALNLASDQVTLQEYREAQWPDACLGLPDADEVCAQTITPGYLMLFNTPDGLIEVHSNRAGNTYRYTPALTQSGDRPVVAVWQRSGGFAGICQRMFVYADGGYLLQDCVKNKALAQGQLSEGALQQVKDWTSQYQSFDWKVKLPPGSADMFNDQLSFTGQGLQAASEQQQEEMANALAEIAAELARTAGN
ncbi:MAG TPA: hypothetical protein VIO36_14050 [Anaerolineaceae bacterium]